MKLNEVQCPGTIEQVVDGSVVQFPCDSHDISFGVPLYKDREREDVVIEAVCDSCGHQFQVFGYIAVYKVDST